LKHRVQVTASHRLIKAMLRSDDCLVDGHACITCIVQGHSRVKITANRDTFVTIPLSTSPRDTTPRSLTISTHTHTHTHEIQSYTYRPSANPASHAEQTYDPVTMIDQGHEPSTREGFINITVASLFSSFGLTFEVRKTATLRGVKETFGKCADWSSAALRYLYRDREVRDDDTPEKVCRSYSTDMEPFS